MSKRVPYFPPGTIRGPHRTSPGNPHRFQFAVRTERGWVPFLARTEKEARDQATAFTVSHFRSS